MLVKIVDSKFLLSRSAAKLYYCLQFSLLWFFLTVILVRALVKVQLIIRIIFFLFLFLLFIAEKFFVENYRFFAYLFCLIPANRKTETFLSILREVDLNFSFFLLTFS